ncbi:MAG: ABC transporter permease subunit [Clostridiales bacterium]|nr:ABC transporter permease subunit [Clostridiales bacterium]
MLLPCVAILIVYAYYPMVGLTIAFQQYNPTKGFFGSKFIGLENFRYLLSLPSTPSVIFNTVFISLMKIAAGLAVPIVFAILLDLIRQQFLKRAIQTIVYVPYFLSWVILGGILVDILSPSAGIVNDIVGLFGAEPVFFLANERMFPYLLVVTDVWKGAGYGTIIYLAAITSIDQALYEAAIMDGANRLKQMWHVTLPGMMPIIVLMATLSLGNILNAGFEQVLSLYSPVVYSTGDIIDTFIYRLGLSNNQYGIATAVGLFKSVISFAFIATGYKLAQKFAGYTVF